MIVASSFARLHGAWNLVQERFYRTMHTHLNAMYPTRRIGCDGANVWPSRSLDLNLLDFFYDHLKSLINKLPVETSEDLLVRTVTTATYIKEIPVTSSLYASSVHIFAST
ncbi:hypothetical protein CDAR_23871 [Caerostris darwini]|uniref:Uncharacterized protein n=1 Tax=Caerostris darwini TaxID=1538125 RepID=A0AAV4UY21_9ARAC|nr:hypothetical protein CDAR_23871 [Caerostris darwini]